jgi:hypothetical protein
MQVLVVLLVGEGGKGAGDMATYFAAHWVEVVVEVEVGARDKTEEVDLVVQVEDFQLKGGLRANFKTFPGLIRYLPSEPRKT